MKTIEKLGHLNQIIKKLRSLREHLPWSSLPTTWREIGLLLMFSHLLNQLQYCKFKAQCLTGKWSLLLSFALTGSVFHTDAFQSSPVSLSHRNSQINNDGSWTPSPHTIINLFFLGLWSWWFEPMNSQLSKLEMEVPFLNLSELSLC